MSSTSWAVSEIVLFLVVGLQMTYCAIRYKTYKARLKLPRAWFSVLGLGFLSFGTGCLFRLYGAGGWENVFMLVGGLFIAANVPIMFFGKAAAPTPPAR
jgi:hypothetical protein